MKNTTLITGASSGIGKGYAYGFAEQGYNLILVARREQLLMEIKKDIEKKFPVEVCVVSLDLSQTDAATSLYTEIKKKNLEVDILVNNAGFSTKGLFTNSTLEEIKQELILNISTLTELCHLFSKDWVDQQNKAIINVSSASAFQPSPYNAVYSSTKTYVLSLTEALNYEYKNRGIFYLAVCPSATDTEFFDKIVDFDLTKKRSVDNVVNTTMKAFRKKKFSQKMVI